MSHDAFQLSATNPVATTDQRDLENLALRLLERPELQKARTLVTLLWRQVMAYPARDQMSRFEGMIDEFVFHYALRAANSDPARPKVLRIMAPPGRWFGRDVPGSRWGGDSPDFIYRMIPIAAGARHELQGRYTCKERPSVTYSVMTGNATPATLALLDSLDMQIEANGEFKITIGPEPATGRANHLQTQTGVDHLLVRDALGDWLKESPCELRVRLLDPSTAAPPNEEELARRAGKTALDCVYYAYYCTQSGSGQPPNHVRAPASSAAFGGMPTQWGTKSNLELNDDEALIVRTTAAGALFRNTTLCDQFFMSMNYWSRTGSLNMTQMAADADGTFTYVVAHEDPGVHNWLDTGGLRRTIFGHRWQAFANRQATETPTLSTQVVKFKDLDSLLPSGVRRISSEERRQQLAQRAAGFARRFADH